MNFARCIMQLEKLVVDNSPLILTSIGVAGTVATAILTGKASFKASEIILEEGRFRTEENIPFTTTDCIREVWPLYIPAIGTAALTVTAIVVANRVGTRRAAAVAAAYAVSERAFEEYRDKVTEKLGRNKEREVRDNIAQDRVNKTPVGKTEVIITGGGDVLCFDMYTGRYFQSDMESIKQAMNDLNYKIINHGYASLNDFYERLGLAHVQFGEDVGWTSDQLMEIHFTTTMSDDQKPCIAIGFHVEPTRNYYRVH